MAIVYCSVPSFMLPSASSRPSGLNIIEVIRGVPREPANREIRAVTAGAPRFATFDRHTTPAEHPATSSGCWGASASVVYLPSGRCTVISACSTGADGLAMFHTRRSLLAGVTRGD